MPDKLRVLDLFSGIGGFSLGLERAGMQTVAFCEIEEFPRKVLRKHWPEVPIYEDVRTLTAARLAADGIGVDVICGGWPCQTYSTAAHGNNTHADMWPDFYRIICEVRPSWVLAENVSRALYGWNRIHGDLQSAGYISAAVNCDTALPERQRGRYRAIIVAYADSDGESWRTLYEKASGVSATATGMGEAMPCVMGMADGVPAGMDRHRLRALGNAVVPQIPELIGRAIIESMKHAA